MSTRKKMSPSLRSRVLLANRNACCVCQSPRVQLHHIDENPSNNTEANIAVLCLDHHDQASMKIGMSAKLSAELVRKYKQTWEDKCRTDISALSRDRLSYYVTLYKNPARIREAFFQLSEDSRKAAVETLAKLLSEEENLKAADKGFSWQTLPRRDEWTALNLSAAWKGESWPEWLPRVKGHEEDPELPADMSPPYGLLVFHNFDAYCQILAQTLAISTPPVPLEEVLSLDNAESIQSFEGSLVTFEISIRGKGVTTPKAWRETPTSVLRSKKQYKERTVEIEMNLRTMYVFSDTAAENLRHCRVRGLGILGSVDFEDDSECRVKVIPLLIGMGGRGQADPSGFGWKSDHYPVLPE